MTGGDRIRAGGFTLIEVLIALGLFGIVVSLMLGGFRFANRAWDATEASGRRTLELQVVNRVFNNMLGRAFPMTIGDTDDPAYAFEGGPRRLRFTAFLPPYPARGGLYTVELSLRRGDRGERLIMRRAPFEGDAAFRNGPGGEEILLLESGRRLAFSYYDASGEPGFWRDYWRQGGQYPRLVKLAFGAAEPYWPDIVTPIRIDADAACVFPGLGGHCRLQP